MSKTLWFISLFLAFQSLTAIVVTDDSVPQTQPSGQGFLDLDRKRRDESVGQGFLDLDRKRRDEQGFLDFDRKRREASESGCICTIIADIQKQMMGISMKNLVIKYQANPPMLDMISLKLKIMLPEPVKTFCGQIYESDFSGLKTILIQLLMNQVVTVEALGDSLQKNCPGIVAAFKWLGLKLKVDFEIFLSMLGDTAKGVIKQLIKIFDLSDEIQAILNKMKKPEPPVVSSIVAALQQTFPTLATISRFSSSFSGLLIDIKMKLQVEGVVKVAMSSVKTNIKMCGCVLDRLPKENIRKMPEQVKMLLALVKDDDIKGVKQIIVDVKIDNIKTAKDLHKAMREKCPGVLNALNWLLVRIRIKLNAIWESLSAPCKEYLIKIWDNFKHSMLATFWGMLGDDAKDFIKQVKSVVKTESLDFAKKVQEKVNMSILENIGAALKDTLPPLSPYFHAEMKVFVGLN